MLDFENEKKQAIEKLMQNNVKFEHAEILADCLAVSDLYGVTSHGLQMLDAHIKKIKNTGYNINPDIRVLKETSSFAIIDGDNSIGPVSAMFCTNYGIKKCKEAGVFTIFSRNNNTFGPAFYYSLKAAEKGCIAFVCSNSPAQMAPFGGVSKMLGTNPFAAVIPVKDKEPIIIDMATSAVAKSKFKEYKLAGKSLPVGWAADSEGNPTCDSDKALGGLVLPMAGFKGYAISMLIDIVAGALSGAAYLNHVGRFYDENGEKMNVGYYMTFINPYVVFGDEYDSMISQYVSELRDSKTLSGKEISLPGDDRIKHYKNNIN